MKTVNGKKFVLMVVIIFVLICSVAALTFFLYADAVRFDYVDFSVSVSKDGNEELADNGNSLILPFFGNSTSLNDYGTAKHYPLGVIGQKNEPIYDAINSVLYNYALDMAVTYDNCIKADYDVKNDGKALTITVKGNAYPDGADNKTEVIDKVFIFDIRDASIDNLPTLTG